MALADDNRDNFYEFLQYMEDKPYMAVPRNVVRDMENPLEKYSNDELLTRYRFSRQTIQNIIYPMVFEQGVQSNRGVPIPPILKLCIALRFYATGSYQGVCGDIRNISQASVSRIINNVSEKLARNIHRYIKFPRTQEEFQTNKTLFYGTAAFPGVIGCIDGTHIEIKNPGGPNGEVYRNRKGWMSLNVQVVAGPRCEIMDIVIRWPGSAHDSRIFNNSTLKLKLEAGQLPGILLGDSAYQQTEFLYTPVPNPQELREHCYNSAHIRTRNIVERTFGMWKGRFRCIHVPLNYKKPAVTRIIAATAVLHNIAVTEQEYIQFDDAENRIVPNPPAQQVHVRRNIIRAAFIQRNFN